MKPQIKAHDFPDVYKWLGINLNTLGSVVLDVENLDCPPSLINSQKLFDNLYWAKNPERFWIKGYVADAGAHITLIYGLLQQASAIGPHIHEVLGNWMIDEVEIEDIGWFGSPYEDDPYYCIVAHIKVTDALLEGNNRLKFLPHINTFDSYRPHVSIAYIEKNEIVRDELIEELRKAFKGKKLKVSGIRLGGNK